MHKRVDLTLLEGINFTQDLLDYMQSSYKEALAAFAISQGDNVIMSGVVDEGATYSNGWVVIAGEVLPFVGGLKAAKIIIEQTIAQEQFDDGSSKNVYYTRVAKCASAGGTDFTAFVRLPTIKAIGEAFSTKVNKSGDTITGALNVNGGVQTDNVVTKEKKLVVNNWNMVTTPMYPLVHGLDASKILGVEILVQDNVVGYFTRLDSAFPAVAFSGCFIITNTEIQMYRFAGARYDNAVYINTPIKICIKYEA